MLRTCQVMSVEHFRGSQVRGRVLVYILKGQGQEWGETSVRSDLRAVTIASNEERAITTITILLGHWRCFQARSKKASASGYIAFVHEIKNGVSKSLLPRVGFLVPEAWDGTRHGAPIEEKQAEVCLGDWRSLILTNPESR